MCVPRKGAQAGCKACTLASRRCSYVSSKGHSAYACALGIGARNASTGTWVLEGLELGMCQHGGTQCKPCALGIGARKCINRDVGPAARHKQRCCLTQR
eukprot:1160325-Pelagomonas_calceolata.AAC.18